MPLSWERKNEVGWWSICALKYLSPHFTPLPESHHHTHPLGPDPRVRILPSLQDVKGETPHPSCGLRVPQGWGSIYPHRHPALPLREAPGAPVCVCSGSSRGSGERNRIRFAEPAQQGVCLESWLKTQNPAAWGDLSYSYQPLIPLLYKGSDKWKWIQNCIICINSKEKSFEINSNST